MPNSLSKKRRLVVLLLLTTSTAGTWHKKEPLSTYSEDLAVHRIIFLTTQQPAEKAQEKQDNKKAVHVVPAYTITGRLDQLLLHQKLANESVQQIPGYIIQVYAGASREAAFKARNKLYVHYPNLRPEVKYDLPNYVVRIGSFLEKLEAYTMYMVIKKHFSQAIIRPISFHKQLCTIRQNTTESSEVSMPSMLENEPHNENFEPW